MTELQYKGSCKHVNDKPTGDYIEIFCSDYNKDYWLFYAFISKENYESDIEEINNLITKLNFRDGDTYIELIDYSGDLEGFYNFIYDSGKYGHWDILNPEYWQILEDKGDFHFKCFRQLNGGSNIEELRDSEFSSFQDWDEVLETFNPDLYKCLDESNALSCFDIEHFYNCQGFHELDDLIVLENC